MQQQSMKILLAEEETEHAERIINALKASDVRNVIDHVRDGEYVIRLLNGMEGGSLPDLILLDIKTPRISGLEVLKYIKSNERFKHIPTVMLSTTEDMNDIVAIYNSGANSCINKPVCLDVITSLIKSLRCYRAASSKLPLACANDLPGVESI